MNIRLLAVILLTALLAGCSASTPTPPPATLPPPTAEAPTATPEPTDPPPTPTLEPTVAPTPTVQTLPPFESHATVDLVNVRANPGSLFNVITMLHTKDVKFTVLGQAPGGEWIKIQLEDESQGWIAANFVYAETDLKKLAVIQPEDAVMISGEVKGQSGKGVDGIVFTVMQGREFGNISTNAATDEAGVFYAFLPPGSYGKWYATFKEIACTSSLMDGNCQCAGGACGRLAPEIAYVILPQESVLEFEYVK